MADLFENPMGLAGFEFVEFASPAPNVLEPLFEKLGFRKVAVHRSKQVALYRRDKKSASELVRVGESPSNPKLNPSELAAWTVVASSILNLDETITKE